MVVRAFSNGVYLAAPPVIIDGNTRNLVVGSIRTLVDGGGTNFSGGYLAGLAQVFGAFNPWQVALRRPPAIAIHDDGDVRGKPLEVDLAGKRLVGLSRRDPRQELLKRH